MDLEAHPEDVGASLSARTWAVVVRAFLVNAPLLAFLLYYRVMVGENRYVTYQLPVLGELPGGFLSDLTLFLAAVVLWLIARQLKWTRLLYLLVMVPLGAVVVLFRLVDCYYYHSTNVRLNAYVLYGNLNMVEEGIGIVRSWPTPLILVLALAAHYLALFFSERYSARLARLARPRGIALRLTTVGALALAFLLSLNALAVMRNPRRYSTLKSLSGEYEFVDALPAFLEEQSGSSKVAVSKPARFLLPDVAVAPIPASATNAASPRTRPDVFIVTVESFNALYTLPAHDLNPALTEDVMPYFRSLDTAGYQMAKAYTSSAYTFNGVTSVLCSQYTMAEAVWGSGCLPEALRANGYDAFSFISIKQLRPYRYENFRAMGFERDKVYDAVGMRRGKKNIYYSFMVDKELFDYAAYVTDSAAHAARRKPLLVHISTNQMHVPGYFQNTSCSPYPFPKDMPVDAQTRNMLNSARCTDRDIEQFIAHLRRTGVYDDALVIITADHAFNLAFWNHKESELERIPMFIKLPKAETSRRIDPTALAAQIDIAPTILDYLGLPSSRPMYGRSLLGGPNDHPRSRVLGISSSHLLSHATASGLEQHSHNQADATDPMARDEMETLFGTVLYFDQHPDSFAVIARRASAAPVATASLQPPSALPH
jgi:phosphoglycerol transferase MdoB-like AlkP superfamily enzyme